MGNEKKAKSPGETQTLQTPNYGLIRGTMFAGRYRVIEELGMGGMGKVYRVEDTRLEEDVALKLLKPSISSDGLITERFRDELKLARRISHKNVCRMYHFGEESGLMFITMEYVPGEDLTSAIRRVGPLSPGKAVFIGRQICEGLNEAHRVGVIHRDLKPKNLMLDREGNVRIMDFGIARLMISSGKTLQGTMLGTPEYMSPEQAIGGDVDKRSDIYSLGIILYEMVTGSVPFKGETALSIAWKHKHEAPPPPNRINSRIPAELNRVILKCLEKNPEKRYQKVLELQVDLAAIQDMIPLTDKILPRQTSSTKKLSDFSSLRKYLIPFFAVVTAAAVITVIWMVLQRGSPASIKGRNVENENSPETKVHTSAAVAPDQISGSSASDKPSKTPVLPGYAEQLHLAENLVEQGEIDKAVLELEKAISLNPADARAYVLLGAILKERGEGEIAMYYYRRFLKTSPSSPEQVNFEKRIKEIEGEIQKSKLSPSGKALRRTIPSPKNTVTSHKDKDSEEEEALVETLLRKGVQAFDAGDYDQALVHFKTVLQKDSENSEALKYVNSAHERISNSQIMGLLERYQENLQSQSLIDFYRNMATADLFARLELETTQVAKLYNDLKCFISDIKIEFKNQERAAVSFAHIITGISNQDKTKHVLFEGTVEWNMEKAESGWRIARISSKRSVK